MAELVLGRRAVDPFFGYERLEPRA
jgi:hypothetical protein